MCSTTMKASPFASPSTGALLKKRIIAWSLETGLPASIHVQAGGKIFNLHKLPLVSRCGYFKKTLLDWSDVELPDKFPGGSETFETVMLFCYNSVLPFDPFNVVSLRCAAHLLEMTEKISCNNLCERSDLYINQVVLQSWDDTIIVLQKCQTLLPWAEDLLIVSRCIESLAFMACMEILDPEHKKDWPITQNWSCEMVNEVAGQDLWIKDLVVLPFDFFKRIICSLRRQGMREKYVSPLVVFYANKWVITEKTHKFSENIDEVNDRISVVLEGIIELLPMGENASRAIPAAFCFSLLSRSMTLNLSSESMMKLQDQVASVLHLAQVEDFLLPEKRANSITSSKEFETMERIFSINVTNKNETGYSGCTPLNASSIVAELWDRYLSLISMDPKLEPGRFMELIELIPKADRETHDHLYRALNSFLLEHSNLSSEKKASVCKYLNCQKLSHETCIEAVQNELMPLHLIVQALFIQQLNTHQAFKECSDSFRCIHYGEFSSSLSKSQTLRESPYKDEPVIDQPLSSLVQKDKEEYESTSFRLQALEQELMSLKQNLKGSESFKAVKKRKPLCQVNSCISLSWANQRKYASRLLKIFGRITMLRKEKSKIKKAASGNKSKSLHQMYNC